MPQFAGILSIYLEGRPSTESLIYKSLNSEAWAANKGLCGKLHLYPIDITVTKVL